MARIHRFVPIPLACLALFGAACGGDQESPREAYLSEVSALCVASERRAEELPEPRGADDLLPFLRETAKLGEDDQERFEELDPPSALQGYHDRSIEQGEELLDQLDTAVGGIEDGADPMAVFQRLLPEIVRATEQSNRDAQRLGLEDCVVELPGPGAAPPSSS